MIVLEIAIAINCNCVFLIVIYVYKCCSTSLSKRCIFFVKQDKRTNGNVSLRVATNPMVEYLKLQNKPTNSQHIKYELVGLFYTIS